MAEEKPAVPSEKKERPEVEKFMWKDAETWEKRRLIGSVIAAVLIFGVFLAITCSQLFQDKVAEENY